MFNVCMSEVLDMACKVAGKANENKEENNLYKFHTSQES